MESIKSKDIDILKKQALFNEFTDSELRLILDLIEKKKIDADETITREGDQSAEIYFIEEGEVRILKLDEEGIFNIALGKLGSGEMFGEMSFIDSAPRSSTIETTRASTIYELALEKLDRSLPHIKDIINKIILNIAKININRLRSSNESQVKTLRTSLRKFQIKENWGKLLIALFLIVGAFNLLFLAFRKYLDGMDSDLYSWIYWWGLALASLIATKSFHLYKDDVGITSRNLRLTLYQSSAIIFLGLLFLTILHYFQTEEVVREPLGILWPAGYFLYCCAYEFVGRGVVFSLSKRFFDDRRGFLAVFVSACFLTLIPATTYLQMEQMNVFLLFGFNLVLGVIFLVQENLAGVILIHVLLGIYANYLNLV